MDIGRLFAVYQPFNHEGFLKNLDDLKFQEPKWLYAEIEGPGPMQGDVFPELEIAFVNKDGGADLYVGPAMLVGNSCDAVPDQDPVVAVAPVFALDQYAQDIADRPDVAGRLDLLRRNRQTSKFYLPATNHYAERYVDLSFTSPVSTKRLNQRFEMQRLDVLRLSERGWWLLTGKLAHHFSRGTRE